MKNNICILTNRQYQIVKQLRAEINKKLNSNTLKKLRGPNFDYNLVESIISYNEKSNNDKKTCTRTQLTYLRKICDKYHISFDHKNKKKRVKKQVKNKLVEKVEYRTLTNQERNILQQLTNGLNKNVFNEFQLDFIKSIIVAGKYSKKQWTILSQIYQRFKFNFTNFNKWIPKIEMIEEKWRAKYNNPVDYENKFRVQEYKKTWLNKN